MSPVLSHEDAKYWRDLLASFSWVYSSAGIKIDDLMKSIDIEKYLEVKEKMFGEENREIVQYQ